MNLWRWLFGRDDARQFPTREPRGKVRTHEGLTTAELLKSLKAGAQPQPKGPVR